MPLPQECAIPDNLPDQFQRSSGSKRYFGDSLAPKAPRSIRAGLPPDPCHAGMGPLNWSSWGLILGGLSMAEYGPQRAHDRSINQ